MEDVKKVPTLIVFMYLAMKNNLFCFSTIYNNFPPDLFHTFINFNIELIELFLWTISFNFLYNMNIEFS